MKIIIFAALIFIYLFNCQGGEKIKDGLPTHPIIDNTLLGLPKKFRTMEDFIQDPIIVEGLEKMHASGSSQFSEEGLIEIIRQIPFPSHKIVIFDLRQESHGFINQHAMSWTDGLYNQANLGKTSIEIRDDERGRLEQAYSEGRIVLCRKADLTPEEWIVHSAVTEKQFVKSLGLTYVRLPVADHMRPSDEVVDLFIRYIQSHSEDKWLHFHCRGGSGRTTTFLALYDMMLNGGTLGLEEILKRQNKLGGNDLTHVDPKSYKYKHAVERLEFLKTFYVYCRENPTYSVSWSEWLTLRDTPIQ
jgi:hypothetical protein